MNTVTSSDMMTIAPFLVICITGMLVLMIDLALPKDKKSACVLISLLGVAGAAFLTGHLWDISGNGPSQYSGFGGTVDSGTFSLLFQFVLLVVCGLAVLMSESYIKAKNINHGEYYALLLFSTAGGMLMASAKELILIFVGLEILSISLYVLSGFARTEEKSEEAAMKYFLLGAFSSAFFLYGIAMIYGGTGMAGAATLPPHAPMAQILAHAPTTIIDQIASRGPLNAYTLIGVALLLVGLFFKAAIVPFHVWTPDVYQGAPTSVTAYMSAAAKAAAFAVLLRLMPTFLNHQSGFIPHYQAQTIHDILWVLAAATMIVGNVVALWQTDVKRLLAYSSIAHAGYLLVGVVADNEKGTAAVLFYLLVYTFMNLGAFGILMLLTRQGDERTSLRDIQGLGYRQPLAAIMMSIFMFSLASVPPAAGFIAKFQLFYAAAEARQYGLVVLGFLASVVGAYYYLMVVARMWMLAPDKALEERQKQITWGPAISVAMGLAAVLTIGLFLFPQSVLTTFSDATFAPPANAMSAPAPSTAAAPPIHPSAAGIHTAALPLAPPTAPAASATRAVQ